MTLALSRLNFRDVGGLPVAKGGKIRSGLLYRSEGPASFVEAHHAELSALGFRSVCDLRSEMEREKAPNDWCGPDCRLVDLDMNTDLRAQGEDIWAVLSADPTAARATASMTLNYGMMPQAFLRHLPRMVDALLDDETPMLLHCTAGKDRTGVVVALLLSLLGVSREVIAQDYAKSDVFGENLKMSGHLKDDLQKSFGFLPPDDMVAVFIGIDQGFLDSALAAVETGWGGVEAYFEAAGIGADRRQALKTLMIEG
jgi:protein-tyrosine phosphatase